MPIGFISQLRSLQNLYLQHNHLTNVPPAVFSNIEQLQTLDFSYNNFASFELWTFLVNGVVDFSNNNISLITNNENFNLSGKASQSAQINLSNNRPFSLTDGIYEMYGSCLEVQYYFNDSLTVDSPIVTLGFYNVDFGTTSVRCTCDLYYFLQLVYKFSASKPESTYPITRAVCTNSNTLLLDFNFTSCLDSTVNFTALTPRLCKINQTEQGLTPILVPPANDTELLVSNSQAHLNDAVEFDLLSAFDGRANPHVERVSSFALKAFTDEARCFLPPET